MIQFDWHNRLDQLTKYPAILKGPKKGKKEVNQLKLSNLPRDAFFCTDTHLIPLNVIGNTILKLRGH